MRAIVCEAYGPPETLLFKEVPDPTPAADEVVIDVHAAGLNFFDLLIIENKYQNKAAPPFSPGAEVAGVVSSVGSAVDDLSVGDAVMAMVPYGGYAERVAARRDAVLRIPAGTDMASAASFLLAHGTAYHALVDRGAVAAGETLLVLGAAGGVGLAAVQLGVALGATVIAASSAEKLELCRRNGATGLINYAEGDLRGAIRSATGGEGVDVIYDPVGGALTEPAFREIRWGGRLLVIGFAIGTIPALPLNLPLLKGASIVGVFWGAFTEREPEHNAENNERLLELLAASRVKPHVSSEYPLSEAVQALKELSGRSARGRVVLLTERGGASY